MKKGLFLVIEGMDGSGKSTQSQLLFDYLKNKKYDVILTFEPTDEKIGKMLTEFYLKKVDMPIVDAFLFSADREEHLKTVVIPALNQGKIVISDRYYHSTFSYQATQGLDLSWLIDMNKFFMKPDLTIIVDSSPERCIERIEIDKKRKIEDRVKFEKIEFLKKLRNNYLKLPGTLKDEKIIVINGDRSREEVHQDIIKEVSRLLT
jgi:dTMP kinase